jgi:hypothetical protein
VARREPEPEHGGSEEGGDDELRAERGGAEAAGQLDLAQGRHRPRQAVAVRAPEQPQPGEREQEHRRPAEQPVLAVDEERDHAVRALDVSAGERGVGGGLLADVGGVGRGTPVESLVQPDVERHAEERELDGADGERAPPHPPERPRREEADHEPGGDELRAQPGERAEQGEAAERVATARPLVEPQGQYGRAGQRRAGAELRVDRRSVRDERRAQPHGQRGAERPRVRHHPEGEPVRERDGQRRDRRQEQLDPLRAADRVGGRDQDREPEPVRLVEAALRLLAVPVQVVGVEAVVRARGVLVLDVDIAVLHE